MPLAEAAGTNLSWKAPCTPKCTPPLRHGPKHCPKAQFPLGPASGSHGAQQGTAPWLQHQVPKPPPGQPQGRAMGRHQSTAAQGSGLRQHRGGTSFSQGVLRSVVLSAHKLRRQPLGQESHLNNAFLLLKNHILLKKGCGTLYQPCNMQIEATFQKGQ